MTVRPARVAMHADGVTAPANSGRVANAEDAGVPRSGHAEVAADPGEGCPAAVVLRDHAVSGRVIGDALYPEPVWQELRGLGTALAVDARPGSADAGEPSPGSGG